MPSGARSSPASGVLVTRRGRLTPGGSSTPGGTAVEPRVEVYLSPADLRAALRADAATGLVASPKELPPKWFYDERGSQLFEQITRLPEYYPTRRERAILEAHAEDVAQLTGADTLVELGAGTSEKTRLLLEAFARTGRLRRFVPFDVSESTLRRTAAAVAHDYPGLAVHAVVGDFECHLSALPDGGRRLVAFLGGTIGNLTPEARAEFLTRLSAVMEPGDGLLLGTDLLKPASRLVAAYDDAAGVTAEFNRNVLSVLNRELGADFVPERFSHRARFDADHEWVEMWLESADGHAATVHDLGLTVGFDAGESMRTEISAKFRRRAVEQELSAAGLELNRWWTDDDGEFAVSVSFRG